jgi:PRTRC genetic system protein F
MSAMLPASVLALPQIAAEIPMRYIVPGGDALTVPLTIALLEAGVISDAMLRAPRNATLVDVFSADERQLSARALSHWWTRLIRNQPCKFFRWSLHVQQLEDTNYDSATTAWFCFTRNEGPIPRFALARGIERLECVMEGFGQTVLAVLRDATDLLPDSFTPWQAIGWAEYVYWDDTANDEELLEHRRELGGYKTVEEMLESDTVLTRAEFFHELPEWVCGPKRILSRAAITESAAGDLFASRVIEVCDALHALVSAPEFVLRPADKGVYRCAEDTVDGAMVLLWKQFDVIGQAIDDALEHIGSCGQYCEFIDANPVPMTADGVREFQIKTEQTLQVAVLTEQLILLLGERL